MELTINVPALAIKLYIDGVLTLKQAAEVADINWFDFQKELLKGKYLP